jgi:hypothetical protein
MQNITSHQENANLNLNEVSPHTQLEKSSEESKFETNEEK